MFLRSKYVMFHVSGLNMGRAPRHQRPYGPGTKPGPAWPLAPPTHLYDPGPPSPDRTKPAMLRIAAGHGPKDLRHIHEVALY